MATRRLPMWIASLSLLMELVLAACGQSTTAPAPTRESEASPPATTAASVQESGAPAPSAQAPVPAACALLTAADVEKITGYGNGLADSLDLSGSLLGDQATGCNILVGGGKFKVEVGVGKLTFPVPPSAKRVDLEGGAKGVVKDSGLGPWMDLIEFPNYIVTLSFVGAAATLDPDKKIATVTKADGSTITYAQAYEALARAVAHNAAVGAQVLSNVSDVNAKDDPCALLTLDEVKQVMSDFNMTGPESSPSAYGGNKCLFRGHSDSLKTTAIVAIVYLTQGQFEQSKSMVTGAPSEIGGAMAYQVSGSTLLLSKNSRYVNLSITTLPEGADTLDQINAGLQKWLPQLAQKIVARMGQ